MLIDSKKYLIADNFFSIYMYESVFLYVVLLLLLVAITLFV